MNNYGDGQTPTPVASRRCYQHRESRNATSQPTTDDQTVAAPIRDNQEHQKMTLTAYTLMVPRPSTPLRRNIVADAISTRLEASGATIGYQGRLFGTAKQSPTVDWVTWSYLVDAQSPAIPVGFERTLASVEVDQALIWGGTHGWTVVEADYDGLAAENGHHVAELVGA